MTKDIYYKPVLSDNEHLLESSETPGRVRGLSRDNNNHNPDIPEWEPHEIDLDDKSSSSEIATYAALAAVIIEVAELTIKYGIPFYQEYVKPFAKERILPRIKKYYGKTDEVDRGPMEECIVENNREGLSPSLMMEANEWRLIKAEDEDIA